MYGPYGPRYYRDVAIRPKRTEPMEVRARRKLGWMSDETLAKFAAISPPIPGLAEVEAEILERKLDPKESI